MLTKKQFDILTLVEREGSQPAQREIAQKTGMSLGSVNKTVSELCELRYLLEGELTAKGLGALEPYRVRRAVFFAAGFGERMVPITLNTPKPLVRVRGRRIIDSLLDALTAAGIEEIYLVRGYLAEQFDQLLYKYPTIQFIENPIYNESNNISSAICAKTHFENAYVLEADLLLYNPDLITKYQYQSNYLGVSVDKTDDWCFSTKNGQITGLRQGGIDCYHMYGISYWDKADGRRLQQDLEDVYRSPGGKERFWDSVPLQYKAEHYALAVRPCCFEDITEIDTYRELKALDPSYT